MSLITDGIGFIQDMFKILCDDGVEYSYEEENDFYADMLNAKDVNVFQTDLPKYNCEVNDIIRVCIVF